MSTEDILVESEAVGVIGSRNDTRSFNIDILEGSIDSPLQGKLFAFEHTEGSEDKIVLAQMTDLKSSNPWHEKDVLKSVIKKKGALENLSGDTDVKSASLDKLGVFGVEDDGSLSISTLNTPPASGTEVFEITNELMDAIIARQRGTWYLGEIYGSDTNAPFQLKHFGPSNEGGFGEAHRIGIFGKSGTGKSVIGAQMIGGFANNDDMGILILDPQGEFRDDGFAQGSEFDFSFHDILDSTRGNFHDATISDVVLQNRESFLSLLNEIGLFEDLEYPSSNKRDRLVNKLEQWMRNERISPDDLEMQDLVDQVADLSSLIYADSRADDVRDTYQRFSNQLDNQFEQVQQLFESGDPTRTSLNSLIDWVLNDGRIVVLDLDPGNIGNRLLQSDEVRDAILFGVVQTLRSRVYRNFREGEGLANALIVLDEAQNYVPQNTPDDERMAKLKSQIVNSQKKGRKLGIGWMFINQRTADFDKDVYSQLTTHVFCSGLGIGADEGNVKSIVGDEMFGEYRKLPDPEQSDIYTYMVNGGIVSIGTVGRPLIIEGYGGMDEILEANNLTMN